MLTAFDAIKQSKTPKTYSQAGFPAIFETLYRLVNHRLSEKDQKIFFEAYAQGLAMIATFLALNTGLTKEELNQLLDKIDKQWPS